MAGQDDVEDVFEGWLERPVDDQGKNKGWLKKSFAKKWKKSFFVLRKYASVEQPFLQWFDKEENWQRQMAKGTLDLYPKYKVYKRTEYKGKQHVFEVITDSETYILAADSEAVMDLWAIQLQMQTRLNPRVAGKMFHVKGKNNRQMQRIGAKDQPCLLHISKWGVTLALQRSHAVLSQWPLTTIRTYESLDCNEFNLEAGRAAPMGQGRYTFITHRGEDNQIFDTIDQFAAARIQGRAGHSTPAELTDDDINRAYDELRFSIQIPDRGEQWQASGSAPRSIDGRGEPAYDHLDRSGSFGSASLGSFSASASSYNRIERHPSWGSQGRDTYDKLNLSPPGTGQHANYDRLDRSPSFPNQRPFFPGQQASSQGAARGLPDLPSPPRHRTSEPLRSPTSPPSDMGLAMQFPLTDIDRGEESPPPVLPPRAKKKPKEHEYDRLREDASFGPRTVNPGASQVEATGSPNFTYLNTAYSPSVEVLPALYATVDKSKKTKRHEMRRTKSYESVCGSPTTGRNRVGTGTDKSPRSRTCSPELIPPQLPHSERVAMAVQNSLSDEGNAFARQTADAREVGQNAGQSRDISTLERAVSELRRPTSRPAVELAEPRGNVGVSSA